MKENIEIKDVQRTEYLGKNGLDMLWAKVKENTHNQVEVERNRAVAKENSIIDTKADKSALDNYVLTTALAEYAKKAELPTKVSQLQNDSNFAYKEKVDTLVNNLQIGVNRLSTDKQDKIIPGNLNISALNMQNTIVVLKNTIMDLISVLEKSGVITVTRS